MTALGFATDLAVLEASGSDIVAVPEGLLVRTAANPTFRWGNFLLARNPSMPVSAYINRFRESFPEAGYVAVGIDSDAPLGAGETEPWRASGFTHTEDVVLVAEPAAIHRAASPLPTRMLRDDDWAQVPGIGLADLSEARRAAESEFALRRAEARQLAVDAGSGAWFGAFDGPVLVSSLGVFDAGDGIARFQDVDTLAAYRRRGLASALIARAARFAGELLGASRLVIVADPAGPAIALYERLGFERMAVQTSFERPSR